ncbi:MAG: hybrid sensor histidine kinase/response regulator [Verrucomicrobia bacterium]|nr:hybrid sensor histidine kinase/response regulator [Verrucomicrobiota bacterium]
MSEPDLSEMSMMDLFRTEADTQLGNITQGLLALEQDPASPRQLEVMMRSAHSLKGAARIVNLAAAVRVSHLMEDCFVAAQRNRLRLQREQVDVLLAGVDLLAQISKSSDSEAARWENQDKGLVDDYVARLQNLLNAESMTAPGSSPSVAVSHEPNASPAIVAPPETAPPVVKFTPAAVPAPSQASALQGVSERSGSSDAPTPGSGKASNREYSERVLRVKAEHVNRMLGLAGESLVESRWLRPFGESLLRLKELHGDLGAALQVVEESMGGAWMDDRTTAAWAETRATLGACQELLATRHAELDNFDRRSSNLSHRLYHEALACRMRPFSDGLHGFPRMVRDVARTLGKEVRLVIEGEDTRVDRDILERLEAPLTHLIRNAIDHGLESPDDREKISKPREGTLRVEARHSAGRLLIAVSDDGRGIEIEKVRKSVVKRGLTTKETAANLSAAELLEFLFLPGFSVKEEVTEISGRGVGLDVVQSMVKGVRGTIRVLSEKTKGTRFQLQLPLTLSVLRTLLVRIGGEPYAFSLSHVLRTLKLNRAQIESMEGRQHFQLEGRRIGLVSAHQVLGYPEPSQRTDSVPVVVLGESNQRYGLAVDAFLGERELVVQPLDARLGKVKDISAGSVMEDGAPVLIVDVEDLVRTIEKLADTGSLTKLGIYRDDASIRGMKRILVVDDSLTVRELERKLLSSRGYQVEVAVDGMDGWNMLQAGRFDLVISDVDMPRMDGIELVSMLKQDPHLKSLPAMIVSYKDREEDRRRGLEAGADYYLSKGSFHDDTLIRAVEDLIGTAQAA